MRQVIARRRRGRDDGPSPEGSYGPDAVEVAPGHLRVGDRYRATFAVVGYPAEVGAGWLEPLLAYPAPIGVALHIEPVPAAVAAERLRRQLARLESTRRVDAARGRLANPDVEVATADARDLAHRLARGEGRLFRLGLYVTLTAPSLDRLRAEGSRLRALCASLLLDARPATFRQLQGWLTTLPLGLDRLRLRRTFDTAALAAAFPFASAELPSPAGEPAAGVLYGLNAASRAVVVWDRFAQPNHNAVILARSGAGKSYLAKVEALRSLYRGVDVLVVDPEDEYRPLADAVGGTHVGLGAPGVRLNPLDLRPGPDALTRQALFAHTVVRVLVGDVDPAARAALDRAVIAAYADAGITADPRTHGRPAPLLADVVAMLEADANPAAQLLGARLAPFVTGSYRGLFDGPTTVRPEGHLVVFSLRDLPDELRAAGTLLTLDAAWRTVADPELRQRRLVLVDEAWLLMRDRAGAEFLFRMAKAARKHRCGLTVVTQDPGDLLGTELGQAVVANAATQILLRQAPQAIDAVAAAFGLSEGERAFLLTARVGQGLLASGTDRVAFDCVASETEHALAATGVALEALDDDEGRG